MSDQDSNRIGIFNDKPAVTETVHARLAALRSNIGAETAGGSQVTVTAPSLAGYGNDYFNDAYMVFAGNVTAALAGVTVKITDYVSATGVFTVDSTGTNHAAGDKFVITDTAGVRKRVEDLIAIVSGTDLRTSEMYPVELQIDDRGDYSVSLIDVNSGAIASGDITAGTYDVDRIRGNTLTNIVSGAASTKATGLVSTSYQVTAAGGWAIGDQVKVTFSGIQAVVSGVTTYVEPVILLSRIVREVDIEAKVDAIQTDIGDPSARTNFQNLEDMLGVPDAANSNVDDILRTGYDSSGQAANEDGAIIERLEQLQEAVNRGAGSQMQSARSVADFHRARFTGNIFFVGTGGADVATAGQYDTPFLTIDYAVGQCAADNNDLIIVLPGAYDENAAAAGVTVDVNGVTIVGCNTAGNQQRTTVVNSNIVPGATSVFLVTADDVTIHNLSIIEDTGTVEGVVATGQRYHLHGMYFYDSMENGVRAAGYDGLIENCKFVAMTNDGVEITSEFVTVRNNFFDSVTDNAVKIDGAAASNHVYGNTIAAATTGINCAGNYNVVGRNLIGGCTDDIVNTGIDNSIASQVETSSANCTNTSETDLVEWTPTGPSRVARTFIDLTDWSADGNIVAGTTMTVRLKVQVDGTNYREVDRQVFTEGTTPGAGLYIDVGAFGENTKVTFQSSVAPSASVAVYYHGVLEKLEV